MTAAFDHFSNLPADLDQTSRQVIDFSGRFVEEQDGFSWSGFKTAIDEYTGDDFVLDKYKNQTIRRSMTTVNVMVDKIVDFLLGTLSADIDAGELAATVKETFTNLERAKANGWANFSTNNSSWEYRIAVMAGNPDIPEDFYTLVTTIKLEADIDEETDWFDLTSSSSKKFSATIDAMQLLVTQGFRAPPQ